ncbi:meiotically up-regulated 65 protein [Apiospora arundinis]
MKPRMRTSRRVSPLKDSDIDHEIILVDHSGTSAAGGDCSPRPGQSPDPDNTTSTDVTNTEGERPTASSESRLPLRDAAAPISDHGRGDTPGKANEASNDPNNKNKNASSKIENLTQARKLALPGERQNKRLQPRPFGWTNSNHKPSPTNPKTAQPPDPSWEWTWPEWRVNHDDAIDADPDGWEYSFMFSKKFSWHGPKWWNSFVRRRAWIRRRIKKGIGYQANDPHLLNPEYFTIEASATKHLPLRDGAASILDSASRTSACVLHEEDTVSEKKDVESVDMLMVLLRVSRIDREKLDAVQNYLEHAADDWLDLQNHMHEIMSMFVFQASRRLLLTRLMSMHDEAANREEGSSDRVKNLAAAVTHAEEELRRLEYWSDVKGVTEDVEENSGNQTPREAS